MTVGLTFLSDHRIEILSDHRLEIPSWGPVNPMVVPEGSQCDPRIPTPRPLGVTIGLDDCYRLGYTKKNPKSPHGVNYNPGPKFPLWIGWIFGNDRGTIFVEKIHPELGGEVTVFHPYFNSLHPGGSSPESWISSTRPCCWVTWHWCWCSYLSTTWRDARATKQFVEKWWKMVETRHHKGMSQRLIKNCTIDRSSTFINNAIPSHYVSWFPFIYTTRKQF